MPHMLAVLEAETWALRLDAGERFDTPKTHTKHTYWQSSWQGHGHAQ